MIGMRHIKHFFGGQSVGVTEGHLWSSTRKSIGRSLKPTYIRTLHHKILQCARELAELLRQQLNFGARPLR